jgi:DNA polymerase
MWVAGETEALRTLGEGGDLYKEFASMAFGVPYDEVTKDQRFIGKTSQLGLIFGVGAAKLRGAVKAGSGKDLGEAEAKRIVDLYRATYTGVTGLWRTCNDAIKCIADDVLGFTFGTKGIFIVDGKKGIRLPSGMYMQYPQLANGVDEKTGEQGYKYKLRNGYDRLYGGKLTNNLVQGTARCIMSEAMVRVSKRYDIVLTIHDALYILAPEAEAEEALKFLMEEMTKPPIWMPDIPLAAEGGYGRSLKDAG